RPSNKSNRAATKDHTVQNTRIIDIAERLVRDLSHTFAGRVHDRRLCDDEDDTFPPGWVLLKATGCQGLAPEKVQTYQPKNKPRNQELSAAAKAEKMMIASMRILVEHVLAGVKRCRIMHEVFRNTKAHFEDLVMEIACGLHNFRTTLRHDVLE